MTPTYSSECCTSIGNQFLDTQNLTEDQKILVSEISSNPIVHTNRNSCLTLKNFYMGRGSSRSHYRRLKRSKVKETVDHLRLVGILPGWFSLAWFAIKHFVLPLIEDLLFKEQD